jgi:hypothetical protein
MSYESSLDARPPHLGRFRPATCRRWGDVPALARVARVAAVQHYFARRAKRAARERAPRLPLVTETAPAAAGVGRDTVDMETTHGPTQDMRTGSEPAQPVHDVPARGRALASGKAAEAMLALCPSFFRQAEQRAAPAFFADLTEDGCLSAAAAVDRFPWCSSWLASRAAVTAQVLDLTPREERTIAPWSLVVCDLFALMLEDISPAFRQVRRKYFDIYGDVFSIVPLRGRFGWRRRARFAGLRVKGLRVTVK